MTAFSGKIWGNTLEIFNKNNVEVHRIFIEKGGYCSEHEHRHKFNAFHCESGEVHIYAWQPNNDLVDVTVLKAGDSTIIHPGIFHQFKAREDSVVYEIYWVELAKDISRRTEGGLLV